MTKKRWLRFDGRPLASLRVPEDAQDVADLCDALLRQMKPPVAIAAALNVYTNAAAYSREERLELHIKFGAIGEDPTDPFIVELSRVWFQLVSGNPGGAVFKNTTPYAILAPEGSRVGDVLEAIFRESSGRLLVVPAAGLREMNLLSRDAAVGASGRAESSPLIVVVRQLHDRTWHLTIDQEHAGAVQKYKEVADLLKDSPEVKTMETVIESTAASGADRFIVLENSSGTGKTQMAFNLEASGLYHVLYVPSACPESSDQAVCKAFHGRTMAFLDCVEKEAGVVRYGSVSEFALRGELYLYAFVAAALRGEDACCGQATRECVERALRRRKEDGAKPFVFFLDEFPRLEASCSEEEGDDEEKKIRMMRNCCRSFDIPVILSSTNATARTMLSVGGRISRHVSSLSDKTPWCVVVSSLPAIVRSCVDLKGTEPGKST